MRLVRFAYDFVVGDDWRLAAGAVLTIALTAAMTSVGINAWWLGPIALPLILIAARRG